MGEMDTEQRSRILSEVSRQLDDQETFHSWFEQISIQEEEGNRIRVCVENATQVRYFRKRFKELLRNAARQALDRKIDLVICEKSEGDTESSSQTPDGAGTAPSGGRGNGKTVEQQPKSTGTRAAAPTRRNGNGSTAAGESGKTGESRTEAIRESLNLRPGYTFDNFVVGPCNRLPHAACLAVRKQPGNAYNPLFLHGDVGLGKTHLLQAICNDLIEERVRRRESVNIMYLPCEEFINHYIDGVRNNSISEFRERIRELDLLVVDDVHFLEDKQGSQEEFFHTFNALHNAGSQIVLSSDCEPSHLESIKERLMSRFEWGLTVQLDAPSWETALLIIQQKFEKMGLEVDEDIQKYIAHNYAGSVRKLEGAVSKITAGCRLREEGTVDLAEAKELLSEPDGSQTSGPVAVEEIQKQTADFFGVDHDRVTEDHRGKQVTEARHVAIYLSRQLTNHSLKELGSFFGDKNHSSIHYAVNKIEEKIEDDRTFRLKVEHLEEELNSD